MTQDEKLFIKAAAEGDLETLKKLWGKVDINLQDNKGYTPLMYACLNNNIEAVNFLLENDADANLINKDGFAVLHLLLSSCSQKENKSCQAAIIKLLLEFEANPFLKNPYGLDVFGYSRIDTTLEIVAVLKDYVSDPPLSRKALKRLRACPALIDVTEMMNKDGTVTKLGYKIAGDAVFFKSFIEQAKASVAQKRMFFLKAKNVLAPDDKQKIMGALLRVIVDEKKRLQLDTTQTNFYEGGKTHDAR